MKLFSFCAGEEAGIGVETQEGPLNLTEALNIYQQAKGIKNAVSFSFLQVLVEMGYCRGEVIRQVLSDSWVNAKITDLRLSPELKFELPIMRPSKIIAMGRNYMAHAKELKHDLPEEPLFFL